jgi:hypothetical protein
MIVEICGTWAIGEILHKRAVFLDVKFILFSWFFRILFRIHKGLPIGIVRVAKEGRARSLPPVFLRRRGVMGH